MASKMDLHVTTGAKNGTCRIREEYTMNTRFGMLMGLVALGLLCTIGTVAADNVQANITPAYTIAPAPAHGFDPLGSLFGIFGLRQDIQTDRAADANLTTGIQDNRQDIHQTWWDNLNIVQNIDNDISQIKTDLAVDHSDRTEDTQLQQQIHQDRVDIHQNPDNASTYRADISEDRTELQLNRENVTLNNQNIKADQNAVQQDRADLRENRQDTSQLRQDDHTLGQQVSQNRTDIRTDRMDIRDYRRYQGPAS
jgi:hypothetical protein